MPDYVHVYVKIICISKLVTSAFSVEVLLSVMCFILPGVTQCLPSSHRDQLDFGNKVSWKELLDPELVAACICTGYNEWREIHLLSWDTAL